MKLPRETIEGGEKTAEGRTQRSNSILGENTVVEKTNHIYIFFPDRHNEFPPG